MPHHKDHNEQSHAECRAEVGERDILVLAKVALELRVFCQRDDGGIVREEGHSSTQRCHAREVKERTHERSEQFLQERYHPEIYEQASDGAGDNADTHKVKDRVEQEVVRRVHNGVEGVSEPHHPCQIGKQADNGEQAKDGGECFAEFLTER